MLLVSAIVMTFALLAAAVVPQYWWIVAWLAVYGADTRGDAGRRSRDPVVVRSRPRPRDGIRQTGVSVGALAGALCFPFVASYGGYRAAFVFAAVLIAVTSGAAFLFTARPATTRARSNRSRTSARDAPCSRAIRAWSR